MTKTYKMLFMMTVVATVWQTSVIAQHVFTRKTQRSSSSSSTTPKASKQSNSRTYDKAAIVQRAPSRSRRRSSSSPIISRASQQSDSQAYDKAITEFVAKQLPRATMDAKKPTASDSKVISRLVRKASNYNRIPPHYRALIDANKDNYYFVNTESRQKKKDYFLYRGKDFTLAEYLGRIIVGHSSLDPSKMMAHFEPVKDAKPFFTVPKSTMNRFSKEDQDYIEKLLSVVNENMSFIGDVPFFVPDQDRFEKGEYAGQFIPEKYIVFGKYMDQLPEALKNPDPDIFALQSRIGFPIWDVTKIETGEIKDNPCFHYSSYEKMKIVGTLTLLQFDSIEPRFRESSLWLIQRIQYDRALKSIKTVSDGINAELKAQANNKTRKCVLTRLKAAVDKKVNVWNKTLVQGIKANKDIYVLNDLKVKPQYVQNYIPGGKLMTSGRIMESGQ